MYDLAVTADDAPVVVMENERAAGLGAQPENDVELLHLPGDVVAEDADPAAEHLAPVDRLAGHAIDLASPPLRQRRHERRVPVRLGDPAAVLTADGARPGD